MTGWWVTSLSPTTSSDAGEFPNDSTLSEFVTESVGATGSLDLDIDRQFASLAEIAA